MKLILQVFFAFFKTGLFAVGGGLATLPFLYEMGDRYGWFTRADVADMVAISESTPGPLGVNMATYVGFQTLGLIGGVIAVIGLIAPSIIVILIIARVLQKFRESAIVERVFSGLRPASLALVTAAGLGIARLALLHEETLAESGVTPALFNWRCIVLAAVVFLVRRKVNWHPIAFIGASALVGAVLSL